MPLTTPQTTPNTLTICLFGAFEIAIDGRSINQKLRARKDRWLLALLILAHGRPVSRIWLAQALWPFPDTLESNAAYNLRRSLFALRRALGTQSFRVFSPTSETVALDLNGLDADLVDFDQNIACAEPAAYERAIARYRAPLLPECTEVWVLQEREQRHQAYLSALERIADHVLAAGEQEEAIRYLRLAATVDPLRENTQRALMRALAQTGDYAAAQHVYAQLVRRMEGLESPSIPNVETVALHSAIRKEVHSRATTQTPCRSLSRQTTVSPATPDRLPRPFGELIGRDRAVGEIVTRMQYTRLLTLVGAGGVGKTRLAIAAAEAIRATSACGAWFVDLATLTDASDIAEVALSALEIPENPHQTALDTLTTALHSSSALIVLDNCEHLLTASAELVQHLLSHCPQLRLLTTSRRPLQVAEEVAWRVPSLTRHAAFQLFVVRAQAAHPALRLTASREAAIAQICAPLEGIPLAIEMAAARCRALPVEQIADHLRAHYGLLASGDATVAPRHQTLRSTLEWSYTLLTPYEQTCLNGLSVFVGDWSLDAAGALFTEREGPASFSSLLPDLLISLVDQSLVSYQEGVHPRYRLLETVRQFAQEKLRESGEEEKVRSRHRNYYLQVAERVCPFLEGAEQVQGFDSLETEHSNLRAALHYCIGTTEGVEAGMRLATALWRFWAMRGYMREGYEWYATLLAHPGTQTATRLRADTLHAAGKLAWLLSDRASAHRRYAESLTIRRNLKDRCGIAYSLAYIGVLAADFGCLNSARRLNEWSVDIFRAEGDLHGLADALENVGVFALDLGDLDAARRVQTESLALKRARGDRRGMANTLCALGYIAFLQHEYPVAKIYYDESLMLCREINFVHGITSNLTQLGAYARQQGELNLARARMKEALTLCSQTQYWRNSPAWECLELAIAERRLSDAVRICGVCELLLDTGVLPSFETRKKLAQRAEWLQREMDPHTFTHSWVQTQAMTQEEALHYLFHHLDDQKAES